MRVGDLHDDIPKLARDNILMLNRRFELFRIVQLQMNKGCKFIKKLFCCVGGGNKVIWLNQLS